MKTLLLVFSFCLFSLEFTVGDADPCLESEHVDIHHADWRHTTFEKVNGSAKCDRYLDAQWYRFHTTGNDVMPTSAVATEYCGTTFPIWANGTLPLSPSEGIVNLTACVTTYYSVCEYSWPISAKRCQDFYVYHLTHTSGCDKAYCIGVPEDQVPSSSTTSTVTPGSGLLPNGSVTPAVVLTDPGSDNTWKWAVIVLALLLVLTFAVVMSVTCYCHRKKTADKDKDAGSGVNDVETVANECYEKDEFAEYDEIKDEPLKYEATSNTLEYEDLQPYADASSADPYTRLGNVPEIENQLQTFQGVTSGLDSNSHGHVVSNPYS